MGRPPRAGAGLSAESAELRNVPFLPDEKMATEVILSKISVLRFIVCFVSMNFEMTSES